MLEFKAKPKKWGNSIGITIPKDVIKKGNLKENEKIEVLIVEKTADLMNIFGSLKMKGSAQKFKDMVRAGWEPTH